METRQLQSAKVPEVLSVEPNHSLLLVEEGFRDVPASQTTTIHVGRGGVLTYAMNLMPSASVRRSVTLELAHDARAEFIGLLAVKGAVNIDLQLTEDHMERNAWARTTVRSILADQSKLNLRSVIAIRPAANQSDGLFEGRAILLSDDARATIIPSLEIEARDVKATHAAAAAPIDPEELFYLQSRGCTLEEARQLILWGFFDALVARIPTDGARDWILRRWREMLTL